MKVIVIGGTGHVGKFMVPMLVDAGCDVVVAGRGKTALPQDSVWSGVKYVTCNIGDDQSIDQLKDENPEVVINMPGNTWQVYQRLKDHVKHIIACGSLWLLGEARVVPTPEITQDSTPQAGRYEYLLKMLKESRCNDLAMTAIFPPNICGPGKIPLECLGGRSLEVHRQHAKGVEVTLPDGPEALIG